MNRQKESIDGGRRSSSAAAGVAAVAPRVSSSVGQRGLAPSPSQSAVRWGYSSHQQVCDRLPCLEACERENGLDLRRNQRGCPTSEQHKKAV